MKRTLLAAIVLMLSAAVSAQNPAVRVDCERAEMELDRGPFNSWHQAHAYFKRYKGMCSDGALAQALSAYKTRLLDRKWSKLQQLKTLAERDPAFLEWVLLGVFYDPEEIEVNQSNTACRLVKRLNMCTPRNSQLCGKLAQRVGPSREYVQACPPA